METTVKIKEQTLVYRSAQAAMLAVKVLKAAGVKACITMQISKNRKNMLISEIDLSIRALNVVKRFCIGSRELDFATVTVADFTKHVSKKVCYKLPNVGKKAIGELEKVFAELGYDWE